MLRTCQDDKICTIHWIVSFDKVPVKREGDKTVEKEEKICTIFQPEMRRLVNSKLTPY